MRRVKSTGHSRSREHSVCVSSLLRPFSPMLVRVNSWLSFALTFTFTFTFPQHSSVTLESNQSKHLVKQALAPKNTDKNKRDTSFGLAFMSSILGVERESFSFFHFSLLLFPLVSFATKRKSHFARRVYFSARNLLRVKQSRRGKIFLI